MTEKEAEPRGCLLFLHATGIASATYAPLLAAWAQLWNVRLFAFDARGFGRTKLAPPEDRGLFPFWSDEDSLSRGEIRDLLVDDCACLFWELKTQEDKRALKAKEPLPVWTFAGHSFGGWVALRAAAQCHVRRVVLLDISILPPPTAALWALACALGQRGMHTLAKAARLRKRRYRSSEEALRVFRRLPFFRGWPRAAIERYVAANFETTSEGLVLSHDPEWEARVFEAQQASARLAFRELAADIRARLDILLVAGEQSEACNAKAAPLLNAFFPQSKWVILPGAGHMYPFNKETSLLNLLEALAPRRPKLPKESPRPQENAADLPALNSVA